MPYRGQSNLRRSGAGRALWALPLLLALGVTWHGVGGAPSATGQLRQVTPPAPTCTAETRATPSQTEGPFYKSGSPQRTSLVEPTMAGTRLIVTGYVLSRGACKPIPRAWLDFWQADERGDYDTSGYRLRGHQFTDQAGISYLETVMPGLYPGRTRHIHVKVRAPNGSTLTTQLYFPGEPRNQADGIFNEALLATTRDAPGGKVATFNFIIEAR